LAGERFWINFFIFFSGAKGVCATFFLKEVYLYLFLFYFSSALSRFPEAKGVFKTPPFFLSYLSSSPSFLPVLLLGMGVIVLLI